MNGEYILSPTPNGKDAQHKFPTHFKDYPGGVEYFDVYSPPIKSLYSQVFWTGLPSVPLPADIVARYHGKGMAVVGFGSSLECTCRSTVRVWHLICVHTYTLSHSHAYAHTNTHASQSHTKSLFATEVDQVRKTPQGDVSVPINVAYNHHFESNMVGANARLEKV